MMEKDGKNMNLIDISIPQGRFAFQSNLAQMSISKSWTRMLDILFWYNIDILSKNLNFCQKYLEILVKNLF